MQTPTLGYEEDTQISKSEIAQIQLTEAIALFMSEKFLTAITLAGAAEEILARLVNSSGEDSVVEEAYAEIQNLREITGLSVMENKSNKERPTNASALNVAPDFHSLRK